MKYLLWLPLFLACTSPNKNVSGQNCWQEDQVNLIISKFKSIQETMDGEVEVKLIQDSCEKRKYSFGERYIVFKNEGEKGMSANSFRVNQNPKVCMAKAMAQITEKNNISFENILLSHQEKYRSDWNDPDFMPVGWLQCDGTEVEFNESVGILLHELMHGLRDNNSPCIYYSPDNTMLCWTFMKPLPKRSFGALETFPTKKKEMIDGLKAIQKIYLTDVDQDVILLFDELLAYSITGDYFTESLKKNGKKLLFDAKGKRAGLFMPLFYNITQTYLKRLKENSPDIYNETFVQDKSNRKSLVTLFTKVEATYSAWEKEMKKVKVPIFDWEKNLMDQAITLRKKLDY